MTASLVQKRVQVQPIRILGFDQPDLPVAPPFLERLVAADRLFDLLDSHRAAIADLGSLLARVEAELATSLAADPQLARTLAILASIPGIGVRVATLLVTDLPEIGTTDRKAIASLAGLAPHVSQSGNAAPRAAISGGRPCVRAGLYMAALVAARHNPDLKPEYEAMRRAGKPAKVALVALARKLVVTANALVKANAFYENRTSSP